MSGRAGAATLGRTGRPLQSTPSAGPAKIGASRQSSAGAQKGRVSAGGGPGSPRRGHDDEREEYITNLKGQLYLLTIENEMMKHTRAEGPAAGAAAGESQSDTYGNAASRAAEKERQAIAAAEAAAAAALPDEFADLEAHMRAKYAQVEARYQQELGNATRAAEALSTQCAAQSSLIAALKQEVASANDVIGQQRQLLSQSEAALGADLKRSHEEAGELRAQVRLLEEELDASRATVAARNDAVAGLRSLVAEAEGARAAADAARVSTLAKFARVYTALRVVLKHWREERIQRLAALTGIDTVRGGRQTEGRTNVQRCGFAAFTPQQQ